MPTHDERFIQEHLDGMRRALHLAQLHAEALRRDGVLNARQMRIIRKAARVPDAARENVEAEA